MLLPVFLLVLLIIFFGVLLVVGNKMIKQNINTATKHLDDMSQDYMEKQRQAKEKLEEAERIYQETLEKAKQEALGLRQDVIKKAQEEGEEIVSKARSQAEEVIKEGEKTRHLLISEIEQRIEAESIKKASQLLNQVIPEEVRKQIHAHLVDGLFNEDLKELQSLDVPPEVKGLKAVAAFDLSKKEKDSLQRIVKEKAGRDFEFDQEVDPELIAGFMIVLGSLVIDGSLQCKIRDRAKELIKD